MMDPAASNCDWLFRRDGNQVFGVLQGNTPEKQTYGPGTCSFISDNTGEEFKADAEWVLTPEELWVYDNNWSAGFLFLGREDQTHIRLHRVRGYSCEIEDAGGDREVEAYDRGYTLDVSDDDGETLEMMLLRAEYPAEDGFGLEDRLRLMLVDSATGEAVASADEAPMSEDIELEAQGIEIECDLADSPPRLHKSDL